MGTAESTSDATRTSGSRRAWRLLGNGLLVLGLGILVWGLVTWRWNDPFTAIYAHREQRQLEVTYRTRIAHEYSIPSQLVRPRTAPAESSRVIGSAARRFRNSTHAGTPIGRIQVSRLGLDMMLVDGTDTASLRKGPGRDERTYMPGEGQLVYIAGHRTTYLAPFSHIDRLRTGDRVVLKMPYATISYRVTGHVIVSANDMSRLHSHGHELLALQACHPRFSARERYIVYARPVSFRPISSAGSG